MDFTKIDIEILYVLKNYDMTSELKSYRIADIIDSLEYKPAYYTVSKHIKDKLLTSGYISVGMRDSRAHTYYITKAGLEFLASKEV